jgi:hypothetical protein
MLFPDMPKGINEMVRVDKPGGRVLMTVYERQQIVLTVDDLAAEGGFKQGSGTTDCFVEGAGIGDEQVIKGAAGFDELKDWTILEEWSNLPLIT